MAKRILKTILLLVAIFLVYMAVIIAHGSWRDWQPPAREDLAAVQPSAVTVISDSIVSAMTWNIGYGGLGAEADFFYDDGGFLLSGGRMIRSDEDSVERNVDGAEVLVGSVQADFFLLQEVDLASRRSYFRNEFDSLRLRRPDYAAFFAVNYQIDRMPLPLLEPWRAYGRVLSGLATLSAWQPYASERLNFPGHYPWPARLFQLDRCASVHRYRLARDSAELVVINVHLSAYDADGKLKRGQMEFLRDLVLSEYGAGHYVIVGGDWNQCPPFFPFDTFSPGKTDGYTQFNIDPNYFPEGWQWIYDPTTPSNRKIRTPYVPGETFTTVIDFFLISPNIQARQVKTIDQRFRFSDHQPVWAEFCLGGC